MNGPDKRRRLPAPWRRGARLEYWLLGLAAVVVVLPWVIILSLLALAGPETAQSVAGFLFPSVPIAGGLVVASVFIVVRRKLAGE